ncbi:hypothetical protein [Rhodopseudomonas parapalustris]
MAALTKNHGVRFIDAGEDARTVQVPDFSTIAIVAPADEANPSIFPLETNVHLYGDEADKIATLGDAGELSMAIDDILSEGINASIIVRRVAKETGDAQASIDRLANSWSAAGVAVGKFVAEATPAVSLLEKIAGGLDSAREYLKGDKKGSDAPRVDQPAGPKSAYPGRFQAAAHAKATREALAGKPPPKASFPGRFQGAAHAAAQAQHEREVRASQTEYGAASPRRPDYSPVKSFKPPEISRRKIVVDDPQNFSPVPPLAASVAEATMQRITRAISTEGAKAVSEARSIADQIRAIFNFQVSPQISPRFGGAAGGAPGGGSAPASPAPAPAPAAPSGKRAGLGSSVHIGNLNLHGVSNARQFARELAKLGNSSSSLHDTVG